MCSSYILVSDEESILGFSFAKLSHPSGFDPSESRLTKNVRLPSDESLIYQGKNTNIMGSAHTYVCKNIQVYVNMY